MALDYCDEPRNEKRNETAVPSPAIATIDWTKDPWSFVTEKEEKNICHHFWSRFLCKSLRYIRIVYSEDFLTLR